MRLISTTDIRMADNNMKNTLSEAVVNRKKYELLTMGVDWKGGGDEKQRSTTVVSFIGWDIRNPEVLDCIYTERLNLTLEPEEEIRILLEYIALLKPDHIAHDYGGAGMIRELLMTQAGISRSMTVPFTYVKASPDKAIINYHQPGKGSVRSSYSIDKSRSLYILCLMIKARRVTLPDYESSHEVTQDLLSLIEDRKDTPSGRELFLITRNPKLPDDFSHSLNFACSAIWHRNQSYPNLAEAHQLRLTAEEAEVYSPSAPDPLGMT